MGLKLRESTKEDAWITVSRRQGSKLAAKVLDRKFEPWNLWREENKEKSRRILFNYLTIPKISILRFSYKKFKIKSVLQNYNHKIIEKEP